MNIPIAGIMGNLIGFKVFTSVYCELNMTITRWGKMHLGVLLLDAYCHISKYFQPIPGPVLSISARTLSIRSVYKKAFHDIPLY